MKAFFVALGLATITMCFAFEIDEQRARYYGLIDQFNKYSDEDAATGKPFDPAIAKHIIGIAYPGLLEGVDHGSSGYTLLETTEVLETLHFYAQIAESAGLFARAVEDLLSACENGQKGIGCDRRRYFSQKAYDVLIDTQQFDKAQAFAKAHEPLKVLQWEAPQIVSTADAGFIMLSSSETGTIAEFEALDLKHGTQIFAAVHPLCGPSQRALGWVNKNAHSVLKTVSWLRSLWAGLRTTRPRSF